MLYKMILTALTGLLCTTAVGFSADNILVRHLAELPYERLVKMRQAGLEMQRIDAYWESQGTNVLAELLKGRENMAGTREHFPQGGVFDDVHQCQWFYHRHRYGEDGHFHIFLQRPCFPSYMQPLYEPKTPHTRPYAHVCALGLNEHGEPNRLFAINQRLSNELWYPKDMLQVALDQFIMDTDYPSREMNVWLTNAVALFYPQIVDLLRERDRVLRDWQEKHPGFNPFEDTSLEMMAKLPISASAQMEALDVLLR